MTAVRGIAMNRVREYRKQQQLSQLELARAIGVARQTINLIENNKYNPTLDLCLKLAWVLQTDLNTLFWREETENEN
jgi:putative transcriptional regulator